MAAPILTTKLYIPQSRPKVVLRPRLIERLNEGLHGKLTLISAPAGFGKTTLISEWVNGCELPAAWLSLDEADNDPIRFLVYIVAALQTIAANIGKGVLGLLQSPQPPSSETILTTLLNEIAAIPDNFLLVLDDYHLIEAKPVEDALAFLIEHIPQQIHLVIATREDPNLPLARLRARGQLNEIRAADLCFSHTEAAGFLNQVMGLDLSAEDVAALETRTEGWIAGLQLAALALQGTISTQGRQDAAGFIQSFTGSHHFVMDYLVEEVLNQQSERVQTFLLRTSILDRLCGSLCDAVLLDSSSSGQENLEYLVHANLFIVPLDNERRWYRYHHLFADLLRQRLRQVSASAEAEIHQRASQWYEDNSLEIDAFQQAVAANDIERAARLMEGKGMPLHFRGAVTPVLNWLESLPVTTLDTRPTLWVMYASALSMTGRLSEVEEKLQAAEAALRDAVQDEGARNLVGHIAAIRALLAAYQNQVENIISQSQRALAYLHPNNLPVRTATIWKLGIAYHLRGERKAAGRAYGEALTLGKATGNRIVQMSALIGLGNIQELGNRLHLAAETYRDTLELLGDAPLVIACEAHLGLARVFYEWNDLNNAQGHAQQAIQVALRIFGNSPYAACALFLARLDLARGDAVGASNQINDAYRGVSQNPIEIILPELVALQARILLRQGDLAAAERLAEKHPLPAILARIDLARGDTSAALARLEPQRRMAEEKDWADEILRAVVLQAVAFHANGDRDKAVQSLEDALALAEPDGFVRVFIDEGIPMAEILSETARNGVRPNYAGKLLAAWHAEKPLGESSPISLPIIETLSRRELEVLQLIADGLSNREISERLFLALSTVKGHNREIFDKLQAKRRSEAVARGRELGLI